MKWKTILITKNEAALLIFSPFIQSNEAYFFLHHFNEAEKSVDTEIIILYNLMCYK